MYLVTFVYSVANNYKLKQHFLPYFLDYLYLNGELHATGYRKTLHGELLSFTIEIGDKQTIFQ